jgi:cell wall assembly regulator SMI1
MFINFFATRAVLLSINMSWEQENMISMHNIGPMLSKADIARVEANLGRRFPDDYRRFLLEFNGGRPDVENSAFPFRTGGGSVLHTLYGIKPALKANDLERTTLGEWDMEDYAMPRTLIPIGYDVFGNTLCLGVAGEELNKVYFRDMERLPEKPPTKPWAMMKGYFKLADSFAEFLSLLGPVDEDAT